MKRAKKIAFRSLIRLRLAWRAYKRRPPFVFYRQFSNCAVYFGPSFQFRQPHSLALSWRRRENPEQGECLFECEWQVAWAWFPSFDWVPTAPAFLPLSSTTWTGRKRRVAKVIWPLSWSFDRFRRMPNAPASLPSPGFVLEVDRMAAAGELRKVREDADYLRHLAAQT